MIAARLIVPNLRDTAGIFNIRKGFVPWLSDIQRPLLSDFAGPDKRQGTSKARIRARTLCTP
ncbi:MAG: hypothetical protein AAFU80_13190 [Pseudomonadota bacterium]